MIPVTIISGQLGAGKTTVILNLIKQLPESYKSIWLKNEYGDKDIDTKLVSQSNIQTKEILNGCLCCVLVGRIHDAVEEIIMTYSPQRIIIETAGTAYPFPILSELEKIKNIKVDGLVNVIDVKNFERFKDTSELARQQAKYFNLVVFNKYEGVEPEIIDRVEEEVYELFPNTQKIKSDKGFVDKEILLGLDQDLIPELKNIGTNFSEHHHEDEVEVFNLNFKKELNLESLEQILQELNTSDFFRIKGIVNTNKGIKLLNYVCGDLDISDFENNVEEFTLVFMGAKGITNLKEKIENDLNH